VTPARRIGVLISTLLLGMLLRSDLAAYVLSGPKWGHTPVAYYVNPVNLDLAEAAVVAAVRSGASTWTSQSSASFEFNYAGQSSQSTTTFDSINLVVFRNASSGSAIATTYWWSNGSGLVDADIVFWDGAFRFFAGTTGCSGGFYIEDIAAHEFGHALGLGHSASTSATMYPSTSSCNTSNRLLDADDIAGVEALYPPSSPPLAPAGLRIVP
jgi:hypothetical protein